MKKVVLFSALFLALLLTGCSSTKRVVCSQKVATVDVDMIMDFKNDVISYMGLKYTMDLSEYSDDQIKEVESRDLCVNVKAAMSTYKDAFKNCKQGMQGKELVITADFDIDKLPGASSGKKVSMEDAIKSLETQGYKCQK